MLYFIMFLTTVPNDWSQPLQLYVGMCIFVSIMVIGIQNICFFIGYEANMIYLNITCINHFHYLFLVTITFLIYTKRKIIVFLYNFMDNAYVSKFHFSFHVIIQQEDFISYFWNTINKENGCPCLLFDYILMFFNQRLRKYFVNLSMFLKDRPIEWWLKKKRSCDVRIDVN